jgi:hypothetical protein
VREECKGEEGVIKYNERASEEGIEKGCLLPFSVPSKQ